MCFPFCCFGPKDDFTYSLLGEAAYKASPEALEEYKKADKYLQKRDFANHTYHIQRAAELGLADAQLAFGQAIVDGHVEGMNRDEGRKWIQKAVDQGDKIALQYLRCLDNLKADEKFPTAVIAGGRVHFMTGFPQAD